MRREFRNNLARPEPGWNTGLKIGNYIEALSLCTTVSRVMT